MKYEDFEQYYSEYSVVPVYEKITADLLTPVLAYIKLREKHHYCFLLESVEGIGRLARYSFVGKDPIKIISNRGKQITIKTKDKTENREENLFHYLKEEIKKFNRPKIGDLPDFTGGIVGYLGYENIALIEDVVQIDNPHELDTPDSIFALYDTVIAFDHYKHQLILIKNVIKANSSDASAAFADAKKSLSDLRDQLLKPVDYASNFDYEKLSEDKEAESYYKEIVKQSKDNITAGDVFQIVLSHRFKTKFSGDLLNVYRALRIINPSPYMYYIEFEDDFTVIGTSPEDLLKVTERRATILPIAGTRHRGETPEEDLRLEEELLADPKERAEHVMLIDLARNDLGRISKYGTVEVTEMMRVQRYSHVMHIVSRVEGELKDDRDCIDALMAAFPAGTLTGAPKIRAMQLINDYEKNRRNVYGGAVGYIDFGGNLDMCIAIRTMFAKDDVIYWQAGAGIVADSIPKSEFQEVKNKSAVLVSALKYAEVIDAHTGD